jgi:hypothetical protein
MFVKTKQGDLINTMDIVRVRKGGGEAVAELRDGSVEILHVWLTPDRMAKANQAVLPALPNFELLTAWSSDGEVMFNRQPIIGWRIGPGSPDPIVVDELSHEGSDCDFAIKCPDGQVIAYGDADFETEALWRAQMEKYHHMEQQKAAEKL